MAVYAVAALQKFIDENKINIRAKLNLKSIWNLIDGASGEELRRKGWIVNSTPEPVQFYVYNGYDVLRWIPAHRVCAQPGETVQVQGGYFQRDNDDMVVYKDNKGLAYNIKRNHLHFWTDSAAKGSRMIMYKSSMERFKKNVYNQLQELKEQELARHLVIMKQMEQTKEELKRKTKGLGTDP